MICWIRRRYPGAGSLGLSRNSPGLNQGESKTDSEEEIDEYSLGTLRRPSRTREGDEHETNQILQVELGGKP